MTWVQMVGWSDSVDMSLSKLLELVMTGSPGILHAIASNGCNHGVAKSQTQLSD